MRTEKGKMLESRRKLVEQDEGRIEQEDRKKTTSSETQGER